MITVRDAALADLGAIVALHRAAFGDSLVTRLGPAWLAATYRAAIAEPAEALLVAESRGRVDGFLHARPAAARRRRWPPPAAAIAALLRAASPDFLAAVAGLTRHELRGGAPPLPEDALVVEYIAVAEGARVRGLGSALVAGALALPRAAGRPWAVTTTVDNETALRLYRRHGFEPRERWRGHDRREYVRLHRPAKR